MLKINPGRKGSGRETLNQHKNIKLTEGKRKTLSQCGGYVLCDVIIIKK
jgi:hypothetical protein